MRRPWSRNLSRIAPVSVLLGALTPYIFLSISFALLMFSALNSGGLGAMRATVADIAAPALEMVGRPVQDAAIFVRNVSGLAHVQAENLRLQQENIRLRQWYQTAMFLEAENKYLKEVLSVPLLRSREFITARIMGDAGNSYVKSFLVSAGAKEGVVKGQAVIAGDGVVGRIVEVGEQTARVLMVTDVNSRVPVLVGETMQHAVMAGTNENVAKLVHLPSDVQVTPGSRIITSGHGGVFPYGLPVGQVVEEDGAVHIQPFSNMQNTVYVRIVKVPADPHLREGAASR